MCGGGTCVGRAGRWPSPRTKRRVGWRQATMWTAVQARRMARAPAQRGKLRRRRPGMPRPEFGAAPVRRSGSHRAGRRAPSRRRVSLPPGLRHARHCPTAAATAGAARSNASRAVEVSAWRSTRTRSASRPDRVGHHGIGAFFPRRLGNTSAMSSALKTSIVAHEPSRKPNS